MSNALVSDQRIVSIDMIRGAVMILMAIDHVRVYAGVPAGGPDVAVFFTRWVTHFCAPAFLFLAGTSAFFYGRKHADISRFLLTRGAWLVFLELTVIRLGWTFNFDFASYLLAGVIWVIGWCMILMAGLVKLPVRVIGILGVVIIVGHNVMDPFMRDLISGLDNDFTSALWKMLYLGFARPISFGTDGPDLFVLYTLIPWIGVMASGYAFGSILTLESRQRDRWCLGIGLGAVALFFVLRGMNLYGDPRPWSVSPDDPNGTIIATILAFLKTTKYPASLNFLLMTLGPTIVLIPVLERARGLFARSVALFGRVPFFFYVLHIPLIHTLAILVSLIKFGEVSEWLFANHPTGNPPPPDGYMWSLGTLYVVWGVAIVILYYSCAWFAHVKSHRSEWWLRYL